MKIYTLMENTAVEPRFCCEHGLSLYMETKRHKILFDTGAGPGFAANAQLLGVALAAVDIAVISHGHSDHGGGLAKFLEINKTAPVYISRHGFDRYFAGDGREIGLPRELLNSGRFVLTDDFLQLDEELELCSCNGRQRPFYMDAFGLEMLRGGERLPDDFRHEQYLLSLIHI